MLWPFNLSTTQGNIQVISFELLSFLSLAIYDFWRLTLSHHHVCFLHVLNFRLEIRFLNFSCMIRFRVCCWYVNSKIRLVWSNQLVLFLKIIKAYTTRSNPVFNWYFDIDSYCRYNFNQIEQIFSIVFNMCVFVKSKLFKSLLVF